MKLNIYLAIWIATVCLTFSCKIEPIAIPEDTPILVEPPTPPEDNELTNLLIGVYWPPTFDFVTDQQFKVLSQGNVDMLQYVITYSQAQNMTILDKCRDNGMKAIIFDGRVMGNDNDLSNMVSVYRNHAGLGGYYIKDEPAPNELNWASTLYKKLIALDPDHLPHVNLLPSIAASMAGLNYETDYMKAWIDKVGAPNLKFLSLDIYPFMADGTFNPVYYTELDRLRRVALEKGDLKTSAYIQSIGIPGAYRRPNENELRYNVYSMLSYGIKHPVWFTYFTPENTVNETFTDAIIDREGNKTNLYVPFQVLNAEMKKLGKVLYNMQSQIVFHTGTNIPVGAESLPTSYFLQLANPNEELLIAQLKNWPEGGRNYAMIVNKSLTETKEITFNVAGWITGIGEVSKVSGSENPITVTNNTITLTFKPGEGRLFGFKPF
jgi:hypothetical protein